MAKALAEKVVQTALELVRRQPTVSYKQMDCQAFLEHCINENGSPKINYRGSNDMFRNALNWVGTLKEAETLGYLQPGVWVFIRDFDGKEPQRYKKDGLGNAHHVGMYTKKPGIEVVHSSASRGGVYPSTLKNGWTHVGIPKDVIFTWQNKGGKEENMEERNREKPLLKKGKKGFTSEVKYLQSILKQLGYSLGSGGIDGVFGKATHEAVVSFQKKQGIKADGLVGKNTWLKLEKGRTETLEKDEMALNQDGEDIGPKANLTILDLEREEVIILRKEYDKRGYRTEISYG